MRCCVIHPTVANAPLRRTPENALAEAVSLARALDLDIVGEMVVRLPKIQAGLLFGTGKINEISEFLNGNDVVLVLIDGPVSPIQQRNLERKWDVRVLDRTGLILEIFADRAQTREGVLQVDLAALTYQKSRLVRSWTHLERQRGGLSFVGGAGETQIEADRRAIDTAIVRLKRQLTKVVKTRSLHRAARQKVPFPIVALVGYTNAGKSTIFNRLTGADVMAKDMLFATLDPTMRAISLPGGRDIILSDTVGFISDLPPQLVAAFRATLEEVLGADLILHVRDISHPESEAQAQDVHDILADLGVQTASLNAMVEVWNKIDLVDGERTEALATTADRTDNVLTLSATTGTNVDCLLRAVEEGLQAHSFDAVVDLGFDEGGKRAWLFRQGVVRSEVGSEAGHRLEVHWTKKQAQTFESL